MALVINPNQKFKENIRLTHQNKKRPTNTREAFNIARVYKNGIFQIEDKTKPCLYDRCYVFSDVNYINRDPAEKQATLVNLAKFLNFMSADFKITVANQYKNMDAFIDYVFSDVNKDSYPMISQGMQKWIEEKREEADLKNLEKVMYVTVSTRAYSYEEARSYFLALDVELDHMFLNLQSIIIPLNGAQRLDIIEQFFRKEINGFGHNFDLEIDDPLYDVMPGSIESFKNFLIFNDQQYVSVLFASDFAATLDDEKVISSLTSVPYQAFCTIDYAPVDKTTLMAMLQNTNLNNERAIAQEIDHKRAVGQMAAGISYQKQRKKEELESYIDQINDNNEACILVDLMLVVTAETEEDLATRIESIKHIGKKCGVYLDTYNWVQLKAFNTALPIGNRSVSFMRAFLTSSLVALQPFYAQDLVETGGTLYGVNRTTNHLIFANRKKLKSPHGIMVGHTGSGKSFIIKTTEIAQTLLSTNDDVIVVDPQNEFHSICLDFGGQYLDFRPKGDLHINPMEIPEELFFDKAPGSELRKNTFIADVTGWVFAFTQAAMKNITISQEHKSFLGQCVRKIYDKAFDQKKLVWQPTIKDLREEICSLENTTSNVSDRGILHTMYNALAEYTEGSYDMFSYPSNVDIYSRFVGFGLANVDSDFWEPVMLTIMFFLSSRMEYNGKLRRATRLIIDETQVVTSNEASADMLLKTILTYRKFGGICTMAMQNFSASLENEKLRDMFSNCGYKCFLDQGGMDAKNLAQIQELSAIEYNSLTEETPGFGLMVWGKKVILFNAKMDPQNPLYDLFSTNFHEKSEQAKV